MEFSTHYLLMADHAMLQKLVMSRIKPLGLTTGQPKVLDFLQDHDGAMQKDIAKGCHIEPSSLSTILGGMERAGLLERSTRDENRRTAQRLASCVQYIPLTLDIFCLSHKSRHGFFLRLYISKIL